MKKLIKTLVVLIVVLGITGCSPEREPLVIDEEATYEVPYLAGYDKFVVEYGADVSLEKYSIIYGSGKLFVEIPEIDTMKMGITEYTVKTSVGDYLVTVDVEDTQMPTITGDTNFEITEGEALNLNEKLTAQDPVDGILEISFDTNEFTEVGEYEVIATAKDSNGNEVTETIKVKVAKEIAKPVEPTPKPTPKPDTDKPDPTPNPTPAPTPAPVTPPVTDNNPFNSSRVPDSTSPSGFDFYDDTIKLSDGSTVTRVSVDPQFNYVGFVGKDRSGDTFSIVLNLDDMSWYISSKMPDFGEGVLHTELPAIAKTYMAYYD